MDLKNKYVNHILLYPIIAGSVINSILSFPVVTMLSVIYPATSSWVIMCSYGVILKTTNNISGGSSIVEEKVSLFLVILLVCAVFVNRLLTMGIG